MGTPRQRAVVRIPRTTQLQFQNDDLRAKARDRKLEGWLKKGSGVKILVKRKIHAEKKGVRFFRGIQLVA